MLICVKSRISELEQANLTPDDSRDLVALKFDKPAAEEENGTEQESGKIKIVAKVFLNEFASESIDQALECLLKNCATTPSVILAYHPTARSDSEKFIWADNDTKSKENFKFLWKQLRIAQAAGKIAQLGIADMDLDTILDIFDDQKFDFTILQINTQTCCVVPPELQLFCKDHDIQLLTHSDPQGKRQLTSFTSLYDLIAKSRFSYFSILASQRNQPQRLQDEVDGSLPRDAGLSWDPHTKGLHSQFQKSAEIKSFAGNAISSSSTTLSRHLIFSLICCIIASREEFANPIDKKTFTAPSAFNN